MIENGGDRADKSDEEDPFHDSDCEGEESLENIKQKAKKIRVCLRLWAMLICVIVTCVQYIIYTYVYICLASKACFARQNLAEVTALLGS